MALLFDTGIFSIIGLDSQIEVGARLYWFVANTNTPTNSYANPELTVPNTNPVEAQADGRFPEMWLAPGSYKYVLTAPGGTPADPINTVDGFVVPDTPPSFDPTLDDFLAGDAPLPIAHGGTGSSSAVNALAALGAYPQTGGNVSGPVIRTTKGAHFFWSVAAMNDAEAFLTIDSDPDPTANPGEIWMKFS